MKISRKFHLAKSTGCVAFKTFYNNWKKLPWENSWTEPKVTDWDVHLFRRYLSKNRHLAAADLVKWARQNFGKIFLKHL